VTIDPTQQSLDKKEVPSLKSGRTTRVSKANRLRQLPSSPPARAVVLGSLKAALETEHSKRKKKTNHQVAVSLGKLRWRGSPADGFATGEYATSHWVASPWCKEKAGILPLDAASLAPSSSFCGKGRTPHAAAGGRCRLAAYAGDGESCLEKLLQCETAAFTECASRGRGGEKGARKRTREREAPCQGCNALQDVQLLVSLEQCMILQRNGPFPIQWHQNLNYIYIIITIAIYLSVFIYVYIKVCYCTGT